MKILEWLGLMRIEDHGRAVAGLVNANIEARERLMATYSEIARGVATGRMVRVRA